MPRRAPGRLELTIAAVGYLVTFLSCLIGAAGVVVTLAIVIVLDLLYGIWTGTFRERLKRSRW